MVLIFGAAIILFTYIPGISAKSIGLSCQKQRLTQLISELKLSDAQTGKLIDDIDIKRIKQDSLLCEKYQDVSSVINYVRDEVGTDEFKKQYGEWTHSEYSFQYDSDKGNMSDNWINRRMPVDVGEYRIMLPSDRYECNYDGQGVTVMTSDGKVALRYPIKMMVSKDTMLLHHPEQLVTYHNDSILLVLEAIGIDGSTVTGVQCYNFQLFKRGVK